MRTINVIPDGISELDTYALALGELAVSAFHEFLHKESINLMLNKDKRVIYFEGTKQECLIVIESFVFLNEVRSCTSVYYSEENGIVHKHTRKPACAN